MRVLVTKCNNPDAIGIWDYDSLDHLVSKISDTLGRQVTYVKYTKNLLHPLTSYL